LPDVPEVEKVLAILLWERHRNRNGSSAKAFGSVSGTLSRSSMVRMSSGLTPASAYAF